MSEAHRAVHGLVRAAVDGQEEAPLASRLARSDPLELAEIAQYHRIHPLIGAVLSRDGTLRGALPSDLRTFFREIADANARRNRAILEQAISIGRAAEARGLRLVALKGAADLLCPTGPNGAQRYLSDLDLLASTQDMDRARDLLADLGGEPQYASVPDGHHHDPALVCDHWMVPVELHSALGDAETERILPATALLVDAVPSGCSGLFVPAPHHRLAHLVAHGQINGHGHATWSFSLRDCHDFEVLRRMLPAEALDEAAEMFRRGKRGRVFASFDALNARLFHRDPKHGKHSFARLWAAAAVALYSRPRARRAVDTVAWLARNTIGPILHRDRRRFVIRSLGQYRAFGRALKERRTRVQGLR